MSCDKHSRTAELDAPECRLCQRAEIERLREDYRNCDEQRSRASDMCDELLAERETLRAALEVETSCHRQASDSNIRNREEIARLTQIVNETRDRAISECSRLRSALELIAADSPLGGYSLPECRRTAREALLK